MIKLILKSFPRIFLIRMSMLFSPILGLLFRGSKFTDPIDGSREQIQTIENQAIGRACRIGQKNQVKIIKMITKDTIEEEIYNKTI